MSETLIYENPKIPDKYWVYAWVALVIILSFSTITDGVISAIMGSAFLSGIFVFWVAGVYTLWFGDSNFYKFLGIVFGGIVAVFLVVVIQMLYEDVFLKMKKETSQ